MLTQPIDVVRFELSKNHGVFLGDNHGHLSVPEWMTRHMADLKETGVHHIYTETVESKEQYLIESFYRGEEDAGKRLEEYLTKRWDNYSSGTGMAHFESIKAAKENNIRVYGIDINTGGITMDRFEKSNPHWKQEIDSHKSTLGTNEKYIVFGGSGHSGDRGYAEIDQALGISSIDFKESKSWKVEIEKGSGVHNTWSIGLTRSPNQREEVHNWETRPVFR